jgi:hypothetical protein
LNGVEIVVILVPHAAESVKDPFELMVVVFGAGRCISSLISSAATSGACRCFFEFDV